MELEQAKPKGISNLMKIDRLSSLPEPIISHILSLMETKSAVQTCVLSKSWRYHWTNVHNLDFNHKAFKRSDGFRKFVFKVLSRRKPMTLNKLEFYCGGKTYTYLVRIMLHYAKSHGLEYLKTDMIDDFPNSLLECQTLKYLFLCLRKARPPSNFSDLTMLTTLKLNRVRLPPKGDLFSCFLNLKKLDIYKCAMSGKKITNFVISTSKLVKLRVAGFRFYPTSMDTKSLNLLISTPILKVLNFTWTKPLQLSLDNCPVLDNVTIRITSSLLDGRVEMKQYVISNLIRILEGLCRVRPLTITWKFYLWCKKPSSGKAMLYPSGKVIVCHNTCDAKTRIVERNRETGEESILFAFPIVGGSACSALNKLATIFEEILEALIEKHLEPPPTSLQ